MKIFLALLAVIGCCYAAPEGEKQMDLASQFPQLSEIIATASKNINDLAANIKTQLNLPDQDKVYETFKTTSNDLVKQFQTLQETVSKEVRFCSVFCFLASKTQRFFVRIPYFAIEKQKSLK